MPSGSLEHKQSSTLQAGLGVPFCTFPPPNKAIAFNSHWGNGEARGERKNKREEQREKMRDKVKKRVKDREKEGG